MIRRFAFLSLFLLLGGILISPALAQWKPAVGPLTTRWAKDVDPEKVHPEYPRPQLVRENWQNLNGLWDYAIRPKGEERPAKFTGKILVPFPVESALSGVMQRVGPTNRVWYRRMFALPAEWKGKQVLLNFAAVDWDTTVWVNGSQIGRHMGGYDPFSFDITGALKQSGEQELLVSVWDPSDAGPQPCGKQRNKSEGIWYTPTTGIWQTVWLEPVSPLYMSSLKITPDIDKGEVRISAQATGPVGDASLSATALDGETEIATASGKLSDEIALKIPEPKLWSPDSPHLYNLKVRVSGKPKGAVDEVTSYFGMRKSSLGKDDKGITRLLLNNKPLFQFGPLDQGFWPDGLYTAPTEDAMKYDLEVTKQLGFNMVRKHVKVEPARWYYWCDKLGLLVWQDMPNGGPHVGPGKGEAERSRDSAAINERELKTLIDTHRNYPCIVMWVPFNEGWGQYDTVRITKWVKEYDPTRLVDCASGWNDFPVGDVHDMHNYPGPGSPLPEESRAAVLGEYGGLGLPLSGHTWQAEKNWGYKSYTSKEALTEAYIDLASQLRLLVPSPGLSAAVYTQTTDVEIEVNGLLTYDREIKVPIDKVAAANKKLYLPPPKVETLVPSSREKEQTWRHTFEKPADGWEKEGFDDAKWMEGPGGFGTKETPGTVVRTEWKNSDIWLRRTFEISEAERGDVRLLIHHDEDAEVYINGVLAAKMQGYTTDYRLISASPAARAALKSGKNTLTVHCKQTGGGQYIDVGVVEVRD